MKKLSCDAVEELLAAYALGALGRDEARSVEAHLAACNLHDSLRELQGTVSLLPLAVPEEQPSPQLRTRILDAARSGNVAAGTADAGSGPARGGRIVPLPRIQLRRAWIPRPALAAIAAALLLAIGVGGIGYFAGLHNNQQQVFVFYGNQLAPNATVQVVYLKNQQHALVAASGLPALPPGKVYEMWLFKNGNPNPVGVAQGVDGRFSSQLDTNIGDYRQFAITIEPGRVPKPTSQPLVVGQL